MKILYRNELSEVSWERIAELIEAVDDHKDLLGRRLAL